jgi:hypothetical protein
MSDVNWALGLQQGNAGDAFAQAFQQGQVNNRQNAARNAMAALVQNPNNQQALQALAQADPGAAQQFQSQRLEAFKMQAAQHQENILKGAEILRQLQPKDQAGWDHARAVAQQAGVDISEVPAQFDPQYAQGLVAIADAWHPQTGQNGRIITPQPGGGAWELGPDGTMRQLIAPNDGSAPPGAPVGGQPLSDADILRMRGGQAASPPATFPRSY